MEIFIYFPKTEISRDELEDALEDCLAGQGEVTGAGAGQAGSNIDLEIFSGARGDVLASIRETLREFGLPPETELVVDGESEVLGD